MSASARKILRFASARSRIPLILRIKAVSLWMVFRIDLRNTLIITLVHAHNRGITWIRAKFGRAFIREERIPGMKETYNRGRHDGFFAISKVPG